MKWVSDWWGIVIVAENDDDNVLLAKLKKTLPEKAASFYDDGNIETDKDGFDDILTLTTEERERLKAGATSAIIFNR